MSLSRLCRYHFGYDERTFQHVPNSLNLICDEDSNALPLIFLLLIRVLLATKPVGGDVAEPLIQDLKTKIFHSSLGVHQGHQYSGIVWQVPQLCVTNLKRVGKKFRRPNLRELLISIKVLKFGGITVESSIMHCAFLQCSNFETGVDSISSLMRNGPSYNLLSAFSISIHHQIA